MSVVHSENCNDMVRTRKTPCKISRQMELRTRISTNIEEHNFLAININARKFEHYHKENEETLYIDIGSNHPLEVIK